MELESRRLNVNLSRHFRCKEIDSKLTKKSVIRKVILGTPYVHIRAQRLHIWAHVVSTTHSCAIPFLRAHGDGKEERREGGERWNARRWIERTPGYEDYALFFYLGRSFTASLFLIPSLSSYQFFLRAFSFFSVRPWSSRLPFFVAPVLKADKTENNRRRYERCCRHELTTTPCRSFCFCKE